MATRRRVLAAIGTAATAAAGWATARPQPAAAGRRRSRRLSVLQFNIWQGGVNVPGGRAGIADTVAALAPDAVTLSESSPQRVADLLADLADRGHRYADNAIEGDCAVIARHPIVDAASFPSWSKAVLDVDGSRVAVYSGHLEYRYYVCYLPRGYGGGTPAPLPTSEYGWDQISSGPITDVDLILRLNAASGRPAVTQTMVDDARTERAAGALVIAGGDFNEPSHLDWTRRTRHTADHHGAVVPWQTTRVLARAGFRDTYRELHPDPVRHPGYTWPADNPGATVDTLTWTPKADERDRIDYLFHLPDRRLRPTAAVIVGPRGSIVRSRRRPECTADRFVEPTWTWPTDHKAVLATYRLRG